MLVRPYLSFEGRCEEALEFYKSAVGAEVTALLRFRDAPEPPPPGMVPPGSEDKILHSCFRIGATEVMATDGGCAGAAHFSGVSLALSAPSEAEANRVFAALGEGGEIRMPLGPTFFSPAFGMLADRFGVAWMVVTEPEPQGDS
ncbi:VOC family protein [Hansschlegelia beijingensis]|uniref:VOC family protein n=1 Tax=Hansschlegelia beijingensis TaxID=1133344 RepID=UPI00387F2823